MGNHYAIINTEPLVCSKNTATALSSHLSHHLLQTLVAADAANNQDLITADVGHGALGNLDEHSKDGLLQAEAQVLGGKVGSRTASLHLGSEGVSRGQNAREGAVHALHRVGQVEQLGAALGELLDVVAGGGIVADGQGAGEAVQAVADGDVERLAEDAVALLGVGDDLRVAPADVEHDGVLGARDLAAHLDVADAVVDAHERAVPQQTQRAGGHGHRGQRRAHARPPREADAVDLLGRHAGRRERPPREAGKLGAVVRRRVLGQETGPRRRDKRVAQVGEDGRRAVGRVADDAYAELVGGSFAPDGNVRRLVFEGHVGWCFVTMVFFCPLSFFVNANFLTLFKSCSENY